MLSARKPVFETDKAALALFVFGALYSGIVRAAHPLITDDTGTQGRGWSQLELTTERGRQDADFAKEHERQTTATLSHGLQDDIDIIVTAPFRHVCTESGGDIETHNGLSDMGLDLKWRFLEKEEFSFAVKAGATFPTGDETRELGTGKSGYSFNFITTFAHVSWAYHLHLSYLRNRNAADEREDIWHVSLGALHTFSKNLRIAFDTGMETNTDKSISTAPGFLILGLVYTPEKHWDLDFGIKKGLTGPETDYTLLAGLAWRF